MKNKNKKKIITNKKAKGKINTQSSNWNSISSSRNRTSLYGAAAQDQSKDLSPRDRVDMLKTSRWGDRNSGLTRQILGDLTQYSISDGIKPQSHSANAKLYEEYFKKWAMKCDITNRFSFWQLQSLSLRGAARDGDCFMIKTVDEFNNYKLQVIEAHKVGNPIPPNPQPENMLDGILFGKFGEMKAINVLDNFGKSTLIPVNSIMHIVDLEYASGARGVPIMQHSWNDIQDEMEILALEKKALKTSSAVSLVINKTGGTIDDNMAAELGGQTRNSYDNMANNFGGSILALDVGESITSVQSNRPSPTFSGFLESIQREISRGILPYEFVSDAKSTTGSSLRMIVAKADRVFQKWQTLIIEQLCTPSWGYVIGSAIANGELPDDPEWSSVSWTTPKRVTVDAGREASNDRADIELGLMSMSELYAQRGLDFRTEMQKRAEDMKYISDLATVSGIPLWTLYKPGFNWLQKGEGKPTSAEVQMEASQPDQPVDQNFSQDKTQD